MDKKEQVKNFLGRLYVPKANKKDFDFLTELVEKSNIRSPTGEDAHRVGLVIGIIQTTGKGNRETYQNHKVEFVDFDTIGSRYAMAYVYDTDGNGRPLRIDIESPKTFLVM